jgi:phenylpropionate dioxygenase-like ring-hydroxylating dioxygenase large terminal subunit
MTHDDAVHFSVVIQLFHPADIQLRWHGKADDVERNVDWQAGAFLQPGANDLAVRATSCSLTTEDDVILEFFVGLATDDVVVEHVQETFKAAVTWTEGFWLWIDFVVLLHDNSFFDDCKRWC